MPEQDSDVDETGPRPLPDDPMYWQQVESDFALIADGLDGPFIDPRPQEYAPISPAPPVELLPQIITDSLINLQAEAAVLAAAMQDNSLLKTSLSALVPDDFSEPLHQRLYAAITEIAGAGNAANPITLWPRFKKDPALSDVGGMAYLAGLSGDTMACMGAGANAAHIRELATRRRLAAVAQSVAQSLADPQQDMAAALGYLDDARKAAAAANAPLNTICMASLDGENVPPRQWVVKAWLPAKAVTYIGGPGGVGKSLAVQQWLTAIGLGLNFMGTETMARVPTLYVTCEDDSEEIQRRNADIAKALRYPIRALTDVHTISLAGQEGNELGTFDIERRYRPSERYHRIAATAKATGARVVALDNVAHLYTGNENIRGEVTQFVNLLNRLALEIDGAVILLGHPAKIEGSEYSGSTAWENAVRSRLFLARPDADTDGGNVNPNVRFLSRSKANYAAKGDAIEMVWHHGAFIPAADVPDEAAPQTVAAGLHNARFLECLDAVIKQRRAVSHNPRAGNFAPRIFAKMPIRRGMRQADFEAAMEALLALGVIRTDAEMGWRDAHRHPVIGLGRA